MSEQAPQVVRPRYVNEKGEALIPEAEAARAARGAARLEAHETVREVARRFPIEPGEKCPCCGDVRLPSVEVR
jgi:hypothetical protein